MACILHSTLSTGSVLTVDTAFDNGGSAQVCTEVPGARQTSTEYQVAYTLDPHGLLA